MSGPKVNISPPIMGCKIESLSGEACERYLDWLCGGADAEVGFDSDGLKWALAHSDDGVTWGYYSEGDKRWRLGNEVMDEISPSIRRLTLQELRLFGPLYEVLIWRVATGFCGRILRDDPGLVGEWDRSDPLRYAKERRILRGDRLVRELELRFTRIADGTGAEQVVPVTVSGDAFCGSDGHRRMPLQLLVRHYYQQDPASGAVRVAASRLVDLEGGRVQ